MFLIGSVSAGALAVPPKEADPPAMPMAGAGSAGADTRHAVRSQRSNKSPAPAMQTVASALPPAHAGIAQSAQPAASSAVSDGHVLGLQAGSAPKSAEPESSALAELLSQRARIVRILKELADIQTSLSITGAPLTAATANSAALAVANASAQLDLRI